MKILSPKHSCALAGALVKSLRLAKRMSPVRLLPSAGELPTMLHIREKPECGFVPE